MHPKIQGLVCCLNYVYNPNANSVVHWWVMVFGQPLHFGKSWHHPWFCKLLTIWHNIFLLNGVCDLLLTSNAMKKNFIKFLWSRRQVSWYCRAQGRQTSGFRHHRKSKSQFYISPFLTWKNYLMWDVIIISLGNYLGSITQM